MTELDNGASYRFAGEGTIGGVGGARTVQPEPGGAGAVFTYTIELQPKGGMRLFGPLLGPMVRSGLKKDLRKLKALLEADRLDSGGAPHPARERPLRRRKLAAGRSWTARLPSVIALCVQAKPCESLFAIDTLRTRDEIRPTA